MQLSKAAQQREPFLCAASTETAAPLFVDDATLRPLATPPAGSALQQLVDWTAEAMEGMLAVATDVNMQARAELTAAQADLVAARATCAPSSASPHLVRFESALIRPHAHDADIVEPGTPSQISAPRWLPSCRPRADAVSCARPSPCNRIAKSKMMEALEMCIHA